MDYKELMAFVSVADNGSFSLAAEQLFITQPAVSKRVNQLEEHLKSKLFDRIGHKIFLTEAGKLLLPRAKQIIGDIKNAKLEIENLSYEVRGELAFGTSHHIGLHRLPQILKKYSVEYPRVDLQIDFSGSEEICDSILNGVLELGVVTLPTQPQTNIAQLKLWNDPMSLVFAKDHEIFSRNKIDIEDIAKYSAVLPGKNTFTRKIVDDVFSSVGEDYDLVIETNYLETIKQMVEIGLGWSVLPDTMTDEKLVKVDIGGKKIQRTLGMVFHKDRVLSNPAQAMINMFEDVV